MGWLITRPDKSSTSTAAFTYVAFKRLVAVHERRAFRLRDAAVKIMLQQFTLQRRHRRGKRLGRRHTLIHFAMPGHKRLDGAFDLFLQRRDLSDTAHEFGVRIVLGG